MEFSLKSFCSEMIRIVLILITASSSVLYANAGEIAATHLRRLIEVDGDERQVMNAMSDSVKLRVADGVNQESSQLCWAFATMNMLETNYLELHADLTANEIELSHWHTGKIAGSTQRRGTSIDAINHYISQGGIVTRKDYPAFGPAAPRSTTFLGNLISSAQLFTEYSGEQQYWSYAFSDSQLGWNRHPDPDALPGTQSNFLRRSKMESIITSSIVDQRKSVTYTEGGHIVQIYGVTFDATGKVKFYQIKDSYVPYFYDAAASRVHQYGFEVTSVENLQD